MFRIIMRRTLRSFMLMFPLGAFWPSSLGYRAAGWYEAQSKKGSVHLLEPHNSRMGPANSSPLPIIMSFSSLGSSVTAWIQLVCLWTGGLTLSSETESQQQLSHLLVTQPNAKQPRKNLSLCYIPSFCCLGPKGQRIKWFLPSGWYIPLDYL